MKIHINMLFGALSLDSGTQSHEIFKIEWCPH